MAYRFKKAVNAGDLIRRDKLDTWIDGFLEFLLVHVDVVDHRSDSPKVKDSRAPEA